MDNWQQIPKKEIVSIAEKSFNNSVLLNKFTLSILTAVDGMAVNTGQFKMLQLQYSMLITDENIKKFLLDDKFITYLKNAGLIEQIKKKETPFKDKSAKSSYYKGMFFTSTDKARILLDKMKV